MGYFTESEIREILADLKAAVRVVSISGKSYRFNDGQGDITVSRSDLPALQRAISYWVSELNDLTDGSGIISLRVGR